jgi:mannitol/fructose-specific phosphotransferase system IIA component (Ntr-type)
MDAKLGDILSEAQILTDLRAANRWEAIDELISNLVQTGKVKPEIVMPLLGPSESASFP